MRINKIDSEYDESGRLMGYSIEYDMSANEWEWIELVIGTLGALVFIALMSLW